MDHNPSLNYGQTLQDFFKKYLDLLNYHTSIKIAWDLQGANYVNMNKNYKMYFSQDEILKIATI